MGNALALKMGIEDCRTIASGAIGEGYTAIGTALNYPARIIMLTNLTDAHLWISNNGVDDKFVLPVNGQLVIDLTTNKSQNTGLYLPEGSKLYCKELNSPTKGDVYFTSFYGY